MVASGKRKARKAPAKAVKAVAAPKVAKAPADGLPSIQAAIDHIVNERVSVAIGKAIEALRAAAE